MPDERNDEALKEKIRSLEEELFRYRKLEKTLSESEQRYSKLVMSSLTGIYVDQDARIVFANERFAEIYGYLLEELIGIESSKLVHPEDRALTDERRAKRLRGERPPSEYNARGLTKDGKTIWVTRRNTEIEYEGRPAILGNVVDITEQKHFEEKLQKANEELKEFAQVISHDLKTPIVSIRGFISRLLRKHADQLDETGMEYLNRIDASAQRIDAMVSDLRTFLRIGQIAYEFETVSSQEIVENVISGFEDTLREKHIKCVILQDLPSLSCDKEKMYQVFENLLGNAIKYMGKTQSPRIEIGYRNRGDVHLFWVEDNGIGIDPKDHGRIFEKFMRLKKVEEEGTGLGLAIVQRIIEGHGGRVWVESEMGKGAKFTFTLPKKEP